MVLSLKSVAVDIKAEEGGQWIPYPPWKGVSFHVRSIESAAFSQARAKLLRNMAKKARETGDDVPPDALAVEVAKLYAEHILLGWEGFDEAYSPDKAESLLTDPAYRDLLRAVEDCANRVGRQELQFIEAEGKN